MRDTKPFKMIGIIIKKECGTRKTAANYLLGMGCG